MTNIPHTPVIIIGAGLSGLATAIQLTRLQSFTSLEIYEKADSLGGTWFIPTLSSKCLHVGGTILTVVYSSEMTNYSWLWC